MLRPAAVHVFHKEKYQWKAHVIGLRSQQVEWKKVGKWQSYWVAKSRVKGGARLLSLQQKKVTPWRYYLEFLWLLWRERKNRYAGRRAGVVIIVTGGKLEMIFTRWCFKEWASSNSVKDWWCDLCHWCWHVWSWKGVTQLPWCRWCFMDNGGVFCKKELSLGR